MTLLHTVHDRLKEYCGIRHNKFVARLWVPSRDYELQIHKQRRSCRSYWPGARLHGEWLAGTPVNYCCYYYYYYYHYHIIMCKWLLCLVYKVSTMKDEGTHCTCMHDWQQHKDFLIAAPFCFALRLLWLLWWVQCIKSPCDIDKAAIECCTELFRANHQSTSLTETMMKRRSAELSHLPTNLCVDYIKRFAQVMHSQLESRQQRGHQSKAIPACEALYCEKNAWMHEATLLTLWLWLLLGFRV